MTIKRINLLFFDGFVYFLSDITPDNLYFGKYIEQHVFVYISLLIFLYIEQLLFTYNVWFVLYPIL